MVDSASPIGGFDIRPVGEGVRPPSKEGSGGTSKTSFEKVLRETISQVDQLQHDADTAIQKVAIGESDSVAEVMTAVEKADVAFRMLMQVRNKLVDAYEELLRLRI